MREKALFDYGNDMACMKREGHEEGREEERRKFAENLRKNGFTEEQIRKLIETE